MAIITLANGAQYDTSTGKVVSGTYAFTNWTPAGGGQVLSTPPSTSAWTPAGGGQYVGGTATNVPGGNYQVNTSPTATWKPQTGTSFGTPTGTGTDQNKTGTATDPEADRLNRLRTSAYSTLYSMFKMWGVDMDGSGLAALVKTWVWEDKSGEEISMLLRTTDAYNKRFPGMAALMKRGQFMSESEYIAQERAYRSVLSGWNLPAGFYDDPTDFGKFIANGVSVKEVDDRVRSAKTFLDSANPAYKQALQELYGIGEGGMLAYVLDADRAQSVIASQMKQVALSGAAESKGRFDLSADEVAKYAGTLGENYNSIGQDQINALEKSFSELGQQADQDARLSSIDQEIYNRKDALDAGLLNDTAKQTASQKRAERERNRFRGTTAVTSGTLSRRSGS